MEIEKIQLQAAMRVERSGSEQQRRRRQQNSQDFAEELEQAEDSAAPETDRVETSAPVPLPASIDIVSIAGVRPAGSPGGPYGMPRGAYGLPKPPSAPPAQSALPAPPAPTDNQPADTAAAVEESDGVKQPAKAADDAGKSVNTLA
jgi:hypothetical protein